MCMMVSVMRQTISTNGGSLLVSRNGCKCKYGVRWFYSKGAFLVGLDHAGAWLYSLFLRVSCIFYRQPDVNFVIPKWLFAFPIVLGAVFSGWLADAKLRIYRVMKYSFVVLFLISLLSSACTLIPGIAHYMYVVSVLIVLHIYRQESLYSMW